MYTLNMNVTIWSRKKTPFFDVEARVIIINTEDENKSSQDCCNGRAMECRFGGG